MGSAGDGILIVMGGNCIRCAEPRFGLAVCSCGTRLAITELKLVLGTLSSLVSKGINYRLRWVFVLIFFFTVSQDSHLLMGEVML